MTIKSKIIAKLVIYFMEKGKFMTYNEYVAAGDGPYKASHIRRQVGSWNLVQRLIARTYPEEYEFIMSEQKKEDKPAPEPVTFSTEVQADEEVDETGEDGN